MSGPWEQDDTGLDFVEGVDDEEEELGVDYHGAPMLEPEAPGYEDAPARVRLKTPRVAQRRPAARTASKTKTAGAKRYRVKVMGQQLLQKFPDVESMLITKKDGSQVLLIRR